MQTLCKLDANNVQTLCEQVWNIFELCTHKMQTLCKYFKLKYSGLMQTIGKLFIKDDAIFLIPRSTPAWWRQAGESCTKQLYQPEPKPVTYVVPTTSILSLWVTTAPSQLHLGITRRSSSSSGGVTRMGALVAEASYTTSIRGPCAGPLTIPRCL